MATFQYWSRAKFDRRAPSKINLEKDYKHLGEIEATSARDAALKIYRSTPEQLNLYEHKIPDVGDVFQDSTGKCWILAPSGIWATVSTS